MSQEWLLVSASSLALCVPYSDDGTPDFPGVGVWIPLRVPKQELESEESIPLRNQLLLKS